MRALRYFQFLGATSAALCVSRGRNLNRDPIIQL
jgi:hypothetical protein